MKTQLNFRKLIPQLGIAVLLSGLVLFSQCKKDDEVTAVTTTDVTDQFSVNTDDGWGLDKSHSAVNWTTPYAGDQALLTGKFTKFGMEAKFDAENLGTSKLSCWVLNSSSNTGEPGRDGLGHCLNGSMGVEHNGDTLSNGDLDPKGIVGSTDTSRWESTAITRYGTGFKATGVLTFKGISKPCDFFFNYFVAVDHSADKDGSRIRASLEGEANFSAKTDYLVTSTSIADMVNLKIHCILKKL